MRSRKLIAIVLFVALALRLGWAMTRPANDAAIDALPDQRDYLSLAQNLIHGRGLQFIDARFADVVWAFRTPGYPLFLAACGGNVRVARAAQAVLDASTVLAIYLLATLLMGKRRTRVPLFAAGLVALNPYLIYFTGLILSETLFTAMLAWGMLLLARGRGGRGGSWGATLIWLCGAVLLGLSVLVRPSAIALPVLLGILAALVNRAGPVSYEKAAVRESPSEERVRGKWPLPVGTTMVLIVLLSLLPWAARNFHRLGRWIWLDTNSGFTLYDGCNPDATGASDQSFVDREPELQVLGEIGRNDYLTEKAARYARSNPARVVRLAGAKLGRTWSPMPLSSEYGSTRNRVIALAYTLPFDAFVLIGLIWGDMSRTVKLFLLAPAVYFSIVHALTVGSLRYRIPAEPPMAVIAAAAMTLAANRASRRSVN